MKNYVFYEISNAKEIHIFRCESGADTESVFYKPLCGIVVNLDNVRFINVCENEDMTRIKAALFGRAVCPCCISKLYGNNNNINIKAKFNDSNKVIR